MISISLILIKVFHNSIYQGEWEYLIFIIKSIQYILCMFRDHTVNQHFAQENYSYFLTFNTFFENDIQC